MLLAVAIGAPFIAPASAGLRSQPECSDGVDNDNDGAVDLEDQNCESADDNSEFADGHGRIPSTVTVRYAGARDAFKGRVMSRARPCRRNRMAVLVKKREGPDVALGRIRTGPSGWWYIGGFEHPHGRFYARARRARTPNGAPCLRARSKTIRVPKS